MELHQKELKKFKIKINKKGQILKEEKQKKTMKLLGKKKKSSNNQMKKIHTIKPPKNQFLSLNILNFNENIISSEYKKNWMSISMNYNLDNNNNPYIFNDNNDKNPNENKFLYKDLNRNLNDSNGDTFRDLFNVVKINLTPNIKSSQVNFGEGFCKKCKIFKAECISFTKNDTFFRHIKYLVSSGKLKNYLNPEETSIILSNINLLFDLMKLRDNNYYYVSERNNKFCIECFFDILKSTDILEISNTFYKKKDKNSIREDYENRKGERNKKLLQYLTEIKINIEKQIAQINYILENIHINIQKIIEIMILLTQKIKTLLKEKNYLVNANYNIMSINYNNIINNCNYLNISFVLLLLEKWFGETYVLCQLLESTIRMSLSDFDKILKIKKSEYFFFLCKISFIREQNDKNAKMILFLQRTFDSTLQELLFSRNI